MRTGYSISELVLSPGPIRYAGISKPDALVILSPEGKQVGARYLQAMDEGDRVFALAEVSDVNTRASLSVLNPGTGRSRVKKSDIALAVVAKLVERLGLLPPEALKDAIRLGPKERVERGLAVLVAARSLACD